MNINSGKQWSTRQCVAFALIYVCILLNHMSNNSVGDGSPLNALLGLHPDISMFLAFSCYEPVLYSADNKYPSESTELSD